MNKEMKKIKKIMKEEDENKLKKLACSSCFEQIEYKHKYKPLTCPKCDHKYWDKPKDEFKLFVLQEEYLKTRNKEVLGKMYIILKLYAKKLIVSSVKGKFYFKKDDLEIKSHDSANKIVMYYLEKPEFKIEYSFGGYLSWPILNVLHADKREEGNDSLNCLIDNENELEDFLPTLSDHVRQKMIFNFEENTIFESESHIIDIMIESIMKIRNRIREEFSPLESLLFTVGLIHKLEKNNSKLLDDYYKWCGISVKENIDKAFKAIRNLIKDLIKDSPSYLTNYKLKKEI